MNRRESQAPTSDGVYGRGDLGASLVLIFPLLLAYEIGVLFAGRVNGADVVTRLVFALVGNRGLYLLVHAVIALVFLLWIRRHDRWATLSLDIAAPVILEAAVYALTLGAVGTLVVTKLLGLGVTGSSIVSALGAGVHEELVFRLGLLAAMVSLLRKSALDERVGFVLALVGSALLFALAHHIGPYGEPVTAHAVAFRTVAGCVFGLVFWYRSLAHAVYAHVMYDLIVTLG
ncbi:MAG TPA: CPBP family intramembrane glutamic endopeptidase [Kofleriaceae bacterium]